MSEMTPEPTTSDVVVYQPAAGRQHTARDLLAESYDILLASFWIIGTEVDTVRAKNAPARGKYIPVKIYDYSDSTYDENGQWVEQVTDAVALGACSIGALVLANALIDDKPIQDFMAYYLSDRATHIATCALAWALFSSGAVTGVPDMYARDEDDTVNLITRFNDRSQDAEHRDRVLSIFERALTCPALDTGQFWCLHMAGTHHTGQHREVTIKGVLFASEAEGEALIKQINAARAFPPPANVDRLARSLAISLNMHDIRYSVVPREIPE